VFDAVIGVSVELTAATAFEVLRQTLTTQARPADQSTGVSHDEAVSRYIADHHCACPDKCMFTDRRTAHDDHTCSERRTPANRGAFQSVTVAPDVSPRA
jgi:hypothetical protein